MYMRDQYIMQLSETSTGTGNISPQRPNYAATMSWTTWTVGSMHKKMELTCLENNHKTVKKIINTYNPNHHMIFRFILENY